MSDKKEYTDSEVLVKYNKLPATKQVPILYAALDYMQQYNGRGKHECVTLAMRLEYSIN